MYAHEDGCNNPAILRMYAELNPGWIYPDGVGEFVVLESYSTCAICRLYSRGIATEKNMLTVKDVADFLGIHTNTVQRWSDKGILEAHRYGPRKDRKFDKEWIERFKEESLNQLTEAA